MILPLFAAPIDDLEKMVNINSGTENIQGVSQISKSVGSRLEKMGFKLEWIKHPSGKYSDLLVAKRVGEDKKFITLMAHADTVFEKTSAFQKMTLSEDKKIAYGPGVVDDKGGIIVALLGLEKYFAKNDDKIHSFMFILSPNEEVGSDGYSTKFGELAEDAWMVLSFEGTLEGGAIVDSRKGNRWYHIKVVGREAHAGRDHKIGINACIELSTKLVEIAKLTNYAKEVTTNVGRMEGGKDKFNIVCDKAEAKLDVRFFSLEARDTLHKKIVKILETVYVKAASDKTPAITTFEVVDDSPPFSPSKTSRPYMEKYFSAIEKAEGKKPGSGQSAGVADANYFAAKGIIVLDGLGPQGGKMHAEQEFLNVDSLESRSEALSHFLMSL